MKSTQRNLSALALATSIVVSFLSQATAQTIAFTWPTDGQTIVTLSGLAGTAQAGTGAIQEVVFWIYDQSTGQWWNGTDYQWGQVSLPASVTGATWTPAAGVAPPAVCCGQSYQLTARVTDSAANTATTSITVQADDVPPVATFSPLTDGQTVSDLSAIGGSVTDNFNQVASVTFAIHERDINGGLGRWWNGTNFQSAAATLPAVFSASHWSPASGLALPALNSGQPYELTVTATDYTRNSASTTITVTKVMTVLSWDPGLTPGGTVIFPNPNTNGGNYWFEIIPQSPVVGVWRTALNVPVGQAGVYMSQGSPPNIYSYSFASANPGSNGFVVDATQFDPGQNWYILVNASTNAQWTLVTGDVFVYNLGSLAADSSSSTNAPIGPEGMIFFQTTIPSTTLAWQLWINGATNQMYVKKSAAPDPVSYELTQAGQMLVVPPYLAGGTFNGFYFIGVSGAPGTAINLDSRQQPIIPLAFNSLANPSVGPADFPYVTYQVQVPVQQIAWQLNLQPTSGNPSIAVRRDLVPNEFRNDAFSEVPQGVGASVSLVPPPPDSGPGTPGLSDGTWFVTIYSTAPYSCSFANINPVITDVHYIFSVINDAPNRAGWRYYRVVNITEQLPTLGWALLLANQVPGTEIALRRNAVPGRWNYRDNDDEYWSSSLGYMDLSSTFGLLQQPGHQADIWYIGVYTPDQALGNFVLSGSQLTGQPMSFDGAGNSVTVADQPPGQWGFFKIIVPADPNLLGWDIRLVGVTNGNPQMVVSRDTLPTGLSTSSGGWLPSYWDPWSATNWSSGQQWLNADWSGCGTIRMLAMGLGNPLEAGTYYLGVQDPNNVSSYTLQSRGIGLATYTIRVRDLGVTGSVTKPALPVGEGDYYRIVVPDNAPDWKLHLSVTAGEALLKVQRDYLPNSDYAGCIGCEYGLVGGAGGGQLMMKPGDEQWVLLPNYDSTGQTNLLPGTYYAVVVSQGQSLTNADCNGLGSGWGSGSSSYSLSSWMEPVTVLPNTLSYGSDLLFTSAQAGGELKFYQFAVPSGIASIEVRLENRVGNPVMFLNRGSPLVGTLPGQWAWNAAYGNYGGVGWQWQGLSLITLPNPNGTYSLSVYGFEDDSGNYPDASYVLRVRAVPPPLVAFDGGTYAITNQAAGTWQFFQINVPADPNLLGWDIRLVGVTNGDPQMVVCRDTLPTGLGTGGPNAWWGWPWGSTEWPTGNQWLNSEWTGGSALPMLAMGVGNPLQPGTYYVGVQDPDNVSSYTIQSRGIGLSGYMITVQDLAVTGSVTDPALPVGEGDYYRIVVPENAPDWKLHLGVQAGEALLKVQRDYLPMSYNHAWGPYGAGYRALGGQWMMKAGDEQWALLPYYDSSWQTNLLPGTYYAVVVSQGQNGPSNGWGTGSSGYTLSSWMEAVTVLPDRLAYGSDLLFTNAQAGGELKFYQFAVPAGIASIEVRLEEGVGNPVMYLNAGTLAVGTAGYNYSDGYGNYGGTDWLWRDGSLITVANPAGIYSLSVYGSTDGSGDYPDASYVLRVRAVPPPEVAFDGGTYAITNQAAGTWQFFQINVPADPNLLGWDIRLVGVTNGNPQMVVSRDTLPTELSTGGPNAWWGWPWGSTEWPTGNQWLNSEWTGGSALPMLAMGVGNPLQPGTYYVGVQDPDNVSSYTIQSRGIGLSGYMITVQDLAVTGSVTDPALPVGEGDYYRIVVPENAPDWKLHLGVQAGEALLKVQRDYLPMSYNYAWGPYGAGYRALGGQLMMKPGDEQWALLPNYDSTGQTNLLPGTYYAVVVSQGQSLTNADCNGLGSGWGSGSSRYTLSSWMEPVTVLPNTLSYGSDLLFTSAQAGGELKFYQFAVPAGIASIEVRLEEGVGNPVMYLNAGTLAVGTAGYNYSDGYGNYGGTDWLWRDGSLITVPNPSGTYSLSVYGSTDGSGHYPDASYVLRVRAPALPQLSFSPEFDTVTLTNVASGLLADQQHAFYQVTVPASVAGAPVLGWKLDLTALNGSPSLRVRENLLPDDTCDTTAYASVGSIIIAPPYLTPGVWYVDVKGSGSTTFSLTSSAITTNRLAHPLWTMPQVGHTDTAPGLVFPAIGDSGVDTNGSPILDPQTGTVTDQGIDLKQGHFDLYAVVVPTNNAGLLRTELQAISGNPNLYLRVGAAPTLNHYAQASCDSRDRLVDRQLTGGTTEYGNWVPINGRYETELTNGLWVLAVQAGGNANARYRLQLSCGNAVANGLVQDLALNGGSYTAQTLPGGDWRYYRVQIPDPAPANWVVTWSRSLGSARMFVRDTVPPGDGISPADFSDPNYTASWQSWQSQYLASWAGDAKNQGPYPRFDDPGAVTLTTPPLRPGSVYYLGFWSPVDTTFSVSSATSGGAVVVTNLLAFYGGSITGVLPGYGSLRYRMDVPPEATRILFSANNSANVVLSLEQGTIALPGGPAHWTSYQWNNSQYPNQANASLNQPLLTPNNWPWLPGYTYYLTVSNLTANPEPIGINLFTPADLAPMAASAPTSVISTRPNPTIQVIWGVTNQGMAAASGSWYDTVWFSTTGVLDANSINLGNFWVSQTVPAGGAYWQTNTVTLPMTGSGSYTLFVQVDAGNSIYEASLSDKVSTAMNGTFTLNLPDLMPVAVTAPATVIATQPNPTIQVAWGVTNQGIGAASGGWYDRVWFSANGVLDGQSVSLGDFYVGQAVAPGDSYWQTNSVTLPMTQSGSYTLFVRVDIYNSILESNEQNNVAGTIPGSLTLVGPDLTASLTVDNAFELYVSTNDTVSGTLVTSGGDWGTTYTGGAILTTGLVNYIHVRAMGWGSTEAFIGEFNLLNTNFVFADGASKLLTSPTNWQVSLAGFGSDYQTPSSGGFNGVEPWGYRTGISADAQWLDFPSGSVAYFSASIAPAGGFTPQFLAVVGFSTGGEFRLAVYGQVGQTYTLQASTDLENWVSVATFTCTNLPTYVVDPAAKDYSQRFYRVVQ